VTNSLDGTVSIIDMATNTVTTTIKVGMSPFEVAVSPDGKNMYVANGGDNTASVIDTATNRVMATVNVGGMPEGIAFTPDGKKAYVANEADNSVSVIDTTTDKVTATVHVGISPCAFGQFIAPSSISPVTISFNPQKVELFPGSSQNVQIVLDSVPKGLSGFNITISVLDPETTEITAISFPDWGKWHMKSTIPSSSVWIKTIDLDNKVRSGDTNVLLGTITLTGKQAGTTDLRIPKTKMSDDAGSLISPVVTAGKVNVVVNALKAPVATFSASPISRKAP